MRAIGWIVRDLKVFGGHNTKPDEWDAVRAVPSALCIGETGSSLPSGEGFAGKDVVIDNFDYESLPANWSAISWSDPPLGNVNLTGPKFISALGVIMSDSVIRPDGPVGLPDLAYGGIPSYGDWAWVQGAAGVVILDNKFARPTGSIAGMSTGGNVGADVEISTTWDTIGTPATMNILVVRSDTGSMNNWYGVGISSDGTLSLLKRISGTISAIVASSAGTVINGDRVAIRAIGRHLQAVVNGKVIVEADDTAIPGPGRAGFFFRSAGGDGWTASKFKVMDLSK